MASMAGSSEVAEELSSAYFSSLIFQTTGQHGATLHHIHAQLLTIPQPTIPFFLFLKNIFY